jgi:hypothetical protein
MAGNKQLKREVEAAALRRMEDAARTEEDFAAVLKQWDKNDSNRERNERRKEMGRSEQTLEVGYTDGMVWPVPIPHSAWKEALKGDFLSMIFDNAEDFWHLIGYGDMALFVKNLTDKQKEVLFLSAVRLCTPQQIACYKEQTDRAVRKLLTAALDSVRSKLAPVIRQEIENASPEMTKERRDFLAWYEKQSPLDKKVIN